MTGKYRIVVERRLDGDDDIAGSICDARNWMKASADRSKGNLSENKKLLVGKGHLGRRIRRTLMTAVGCEDEGKAEGLTSLSGGGNGAHGGKMKPRRLSNCYASEEREEEESEEVCKRKTGESAARMENMSEQVEGRLSKQRITAGPIFAFTKDDRWASPQRRRSGRDGDICPLARSILGPLRTLQHVSASCSPRPSTSIAASTNVGFTQRRGLCSSSSGFALQFCMSRDLTVC